MFETIEERIKAIFSGRPHRHRYYDETVKHAHDMGIHVEGREPKSLLEQKRPNEQIEQRDYRLRVWKPVTESLSNKVVNTVAKIFDPKLFKLDFGQERPAAIPQSEDLQEYLTNEFGIWKSIWIWTRETDLVKLFSDPNSLCLVMPENPEAEQGEFFRPIPFIFTAEQLIDFVDDEFYIVFVEDKKTNINKLYLIDRESIKIWKMKNKDFDNARLVLELPTGFMPAFRLGGQVKGDVEPYWFKSFIAGVQPHWDKVVTMTSDLDGATVNHLFPSMWEWQVECNQCYGTGRVERKGNILAPSGAQNVVELDCQRCYGTGTVTNKSPLGIHSIKRDAINPDLPSPVPPAGYITKDIEPLRELKKSIDEAVLAGYSSINMEILHKVGENQSGIAKTIDRSPLLSFLLRVGQHVADCNILPVVEITARWRYGTIFQNRMSQLDDYIKSITINMAQEFSVIGLDMLMEELKGATAAGLSDQQIKRIESDIVNTKFANNPELQKKALAVVNLKPFPSKTGDEIALDVSSGLIRKEDAIRNKNIDELVTRAMNENPNFLDLEETEQIDILNEIIARDFMGDDVETIPVEPDEPEDEEEVEEEEFDQEELAEVEEEDG